MELAVVGTDKNKKIASPNSSLSIDSESSRLHALIETQLLDSPPERAFDRLTELICKMLQVPVALVVMVDHDRQFFKSGQGLPDELAQSRQTPLAYSFCQHTVAQREPLVIADARQNPLVQDNPAVSEMNVTAYLGVPLFTPDGHAIGTLCAIDHQPREWRESDVHLVSELADVAMSELAMRAALRERQRAEAMLREKNAVIDAIMENTAGLIYMKDRAGRLMMANAATLRAIGRTAEQAIGKDNVGYLDNQEEARRVMESDARIMNSGVSASIEESVMLPDGRHIFHSHKAPYRNPCGEVIGLVGMSSDITELKRTQEGLARLQQMTASFSATSMPKGILETALQACRDLMGAVGGYASVLSPNADALNLMCSFGYDTTGLDARKTISLQWNMPTRAAIETKKAVWVTSQKELQDSFPETLEHMRQSFEIHAIVVLPLVNDDAALGVIALCFDRDYHLIEAEKEMLQAMASQCAHALKRAQLYEAEQRARIEADFAAKQADFMAETSRVLTVAFDLAERLQSTAKIAVPFLADWCTVNLIDKDGGITLAGLAHKSPEGYAFVKEWAARFPLRINQNPSTWEPLRSGMSVLFSHITENEIEMFTRNEPEQVDWWMKAHVASMMVVPLVTQGRTIGAVKLVRCSAEQAYGPDDLARAEEWASRVAPLIDNARLYQELQAFNKSLEERVVERTAQFKASRDQLRSLAARLQAAREEERSRIAREVHDVIGQYMTALKIGVSMLGKKIEEGSEAHKKTKDLLALLDEAIRSVRRVATDLRPSILDDMGLVAALEWQLREFAMRSNLDYTFNCNIDELSLEPDKTTAIFRLVQESLTNVARHAQATHVELGVSVAQGQLIVQIKDDGRGISPEEVRGAKSLGLVGMHERVHLIAGTLDISGAPGKGTTVTVAVPM